MNSFGPDIPPASPSRMHEVDRLVAERTAELQAANDRLRIECQQLLEREAALRESELQYRVLFEHSAAGVAQVGLDGHFLKVNRRFADMLLYTPDELIGRRFMELTHSDHLEKDLAAFDEMLSGHSSTYATEKRYLRKDGSTIWTHITVSLVRDADGRPNYFVTVVEDISQNKDDQGALSRSQRLLQSILDNTTAVIYIKNPDGRYELINRRYEALFHVSRTDVVGKTDFDIFPPETAQRLRANDLHVVQSQQPLELEETVPHDDGPHTYFSIKVPIIDDSGRSVALCGISTDISELKQDEAKLKEAKEAAEQANLAKGRFLANMSHEIRTPIMALLAAAENIRGGSLGTGELREHGEVILRNGRHLLALVDDLLDQSRIDADRLQIVQTPSSLSEILADVYAVTRPLLHNKSVEYRVQFESPVPEQVVTDRTRLTQAVINLIHNAIKFTQRGHVWVRVRVERVDQADVLTIAIEDTGPGIPAGELGRIFEPFVQVGSTDRGALAGVGLGLSLARWIARRLGGDVTVQSREQEGSTFSLSVPVGLTESTAWLDVTTMEQRISLCESSTSPPPFRLSGSVLLAEDAEDVRRLLSRALENAGVSVTAVGDGALALETASAHFYDLILLDIRMPRLDGLETARAIRQGGYAGPLIALTASTTKHERERILAAGFDDLWLKPISLHRFLELASAYLGSAPDARPVTGFEYGEEFEKNRFEFARLLPARLQRLRDFLQSSDLSGAGGLLHQLSGSGGIMGFPEISCAAKAAEVELAAGRLGLSSPAFLRLAGKMEQIGTQFAPKPIENQ